MVWPLQFISAQVDEDDWATIEVTNISTSAATVTVSLSEGAEGGTLYLHYRAVPGGPWVGEDRLLFSNGVVQTILANLEAGTNYEVQVSRESTFPETGSLSETFSTLPPDPYVSGVDVENKTPTAAEVVVTIAHPGSQPHMVHIRYRTDDSQPWSDPPIVETTSGGTVRVKLSNLISGTSYEVEASLGSNFIAGETESDSFRTPLPRVAEMSVRDKTTSRATIDVTIVESGSETQTVYLRYAAGLAPRTSWADVPAMSAVGDSASFALTDLAPGTCHEVQASLDRNFVDGVVTLTFSTDSLPSLGAVNVASVSGRSARIAVTIFDPDGTEVTVYMRYREWSAVSWGATLSESSSNNRVEFVLSSLKPGTEYEVEASLSSGFEASLSKLFTAEEEVTRVSSLTPGK